MLTRQSRQSTRLFLSRPTLEPLPAGECVLPLWLGGGGGMTHSLAGEGVGGPSLEEGTDTVAL